MTSFFPFSQSSSSLSTVNNDDPHLQIIVTPSAAAFFAGETFSATITFRNTREAQHASDVPPTTGTALTTPAAALRNMRTTHGERRGAIGLPRRKGQVGLHLDSEPEPPSAGVGPSRRSPLSLTPGPRGHGVGYPYSPGANPAYRAPGWPGMDGSVIRSPDDRKRREEGRGHGRRTRSLALGKAGMSPQEMVWALGGQPPPLLPPRRPPGGTDIPKHHPHSRKISIASSVTSPSTTSSPLPADLLPIPESSGSLDALVAEAGLNRPSSRSTAPSSATSSRSRLDLYDEGSVTSSSNTAPRRPSPSPSVLHSRAPSYNNAYGASLLSLGGNLPPPPQHPYIRSKDPPGTTTLLWAYTRLVGRFHPSNAYIPPDPLLPLRSLLLHQPVGSGSLQSSPSVDSSGTFKPSGSRWQLSFGTGAIGNSTQPSLTGSPFGLAKELVSGGSGGSLEEERRRVWNLKYLPVLETSKGLLGVDVKLKEGETREFTYTFQLPTDLPPSHRGKAFRFSYELLVSLTVLLPGSGKRQKSKEIAIPIRVWANVALSHPLRTYNVLNPIIQTTQEGKITESDASAPTRPSVTMERSRSREGGSEGSLQEYAKHLLNTVTTPQSPPQNGDSPSPRRVPLSPSRKPLKPLSSPTSPDPPNGIIQSSANGHLSVPDSAIRGPAESRKRHGSFVRGDDKLVEEDNESCGEAVEILSRLSSKVTYDIAKDGELVATLTLVKTTYRLGESVTGVVNLNSPDTERRVLKLSAFLESHEIIPEPLLPVPSSFTGKSRQPPLSRLHADHRSGYTIHTSRLGFALDIPSDGTPGFSIGAGEGGPGGLEWRVRLAMLVVTPRRASNKGSDSRVTRKKGVHLVPMGQDGDNQTFAASTTLSPLVSREDERDPKDERGWVETQTEMVECEIPIRVLAGNTAFVVRPAVYTV